MPPCVMPRRSRVICSNGTHHRVGAWGYRPRSRGWDRPASGRGGCARVAPQPAQGGLRHLTPWKYGTVIRASTYPNYFDYNAVRVERETPMGFGELAAFADRALNGLAHRRVDFEVTAPAERARADFEAGGWKTMRLLWMRHRSLAPTPAGTRAGGRLRRGAEAAAGMAPGGLRLPAHRRLVLRPVARACAQTRRARPRRVSRTASRSRSHS